MTHCYFRDVKFWFKDLSAKNDRFTAVPNGNSSKSVTNILFVLILNKMSLPV